MCNSPTVGTQVRSENDLDECRDGTVIGYDDDLGLPVIEWNAESGYPIREACEPNQYEVI